eukprot:142475-Prymnesium_polylepis.1
MLRSKLPLSYGVPACGTEPHAISVDRSGRSIVRRVRAGTHAWVGEEMCGRRSLVPRSSPSTCA